MVMILIKMAGVFAKSQTCLIKQNKVENVVVKKIPKCKGCGGSGHYEVSCLKTPRKPIKSKKPLKASVTPSKRVRRAKKSITLSKAKDKAWKAFSDYIRLRDCLKTTKTSDYCICITCNERGDPSWKPYNKIQAGHAVGGRSNGILFHEEIVNGQCGYCNRKPPMGLGGDYGNYAIALIKIYGIEHVSALQALKYKTIKYSIPELLEIEDKYKKKRIKLEKSIDI